MELTEETLEHLRNEALVGLCREKAEGQLLEIERRKEDLRSTRSPFAVFSKRESKETFQRAVRAADEAASSQRLRLALLQEVERRLGPIIRADLELYLESSSADYQQLSTNLRSIGVWQRKLRESADTLTAFARELRELRRAAPGAPRTRAVATVREVAQRLAAVHTHLAGIARDVTAILAATGEALTLPELAEMNRVPWVQRLSVLTPQQIDVEGSYVETETRRFLAGGLEPACAAAEPCRLALQTRADAYLDHYWLQLRAYAREHLAQEFDVDATVAELTARYIDAALDRYQEELAATPFLVDR